YSVGIHSAANAGAVDYARHLALPVLVLSVQLIAGWSRYQRASMLDVMSADYIRTARAKGVSRRTVLFKHALRNALIPLVTVLATGQAPAEATLAVPVGETVARSQWTLIRRRFLRHRLAVVALGVLILLYLTAVFAKELSPFDLNPKLTGSVLADARHGPSFKHLLGTDELGRDQLTRILYAGRISLFVGLSVALVSTVFGTFVGALAGYF